MLQSSRTGIRRQTRWTHGCCEYFIMYCVVLAAVPDAIFVVTAVVVDVCNDHKFFTWLFSVYKPKAETDKICQIVWHLFGKHCWLCKNFVDFFTKMLLVIHSQFCVNSTHLTVSISADHFPFVSCQHWKHAECQRYLSDKRSLLANKHLRHISSNRPTQ